MTHSNLDETESYSPMKHTRLVSDGDRFFEVPTRPSSPPFPHFPLNHEIDLISASPVATLPTLTQPLATTASSAVPTAVAPTRSGPVPPPSTHTTGTGGPQPAISPEAARDIVEAYIRASGWFEADEMEPRADRADVPKCALQLANPGDSIWACFFKRKRQHGSLVFKCVGCVHKTDRYNRAVDHQRAEWSHKPFACTDSGCDFRGSTSGSVADHCSARTDTAQCEDCGKHIMVKNMPRHLLQHRY